MKPSITKEVYASPQHDQSLHKAWLRGAISGVLLQGTGLLLAFVSSVLLATILGPEGLGQYSYVMAIVAVLSGIATLGLPIVITRQLATYQATSSWELGAGLLSYSNLIVGGTSLLLVVGLVIYGSSMVSGEMQRLVFWASPLVLVLAFSILRQRTLQALHHPIAAQIPEQF